MSRKLSSFAAIEPLEARIAPATVYPKVIDAVWRTATLGTPLEIHAGEGLSTLGNKAGSYLLFVEKGTALIFTTDLNNNNVLEPNEITGIAASDGLRLISFVDIHGDIVTNLQATSTSGGIRYTLSDSDRNPANDDPQLGGDGKVVLNSTIEKIEMRPLLITDIPDQDGVGLDENGDGKIDGADDIDLALRTVPFSSYSIFGNIITGGTFGANDGGLQFNAPANATYLPRVDGIYTGSAVSGKFFSFGAAREEIIANVKVGDNINGIITPFIPARGQIGASINTVKGTGPFDIGTLHAGSGGIGAVGGSILNITMTGDDTGGYSLIAGDGGGGPSGGDGGSIVNFNDTGSNTAQVYIHTGSGGFGATGSGGNAGNSQFGTLNLKGDIRVDLGDGGGGFTLGGNGASLSKGIFTQPDDVLVEGTNGFGTTHLASTKDGLFHSVIGTNQMIDFDNDGVGDFVYVTKTTSTLTVLFGDKVLNPAGIPDPNDPTNPAKNFDPLPTYRTVTNADGTQSPGIFLQGPRNALALAVGDVNGDGHPDIVTATGDTGGTGDVMIFLSKFEDLNDDGVLSVDEDLNHNGLNDFLGFWEPRHTTIATQYDRYVMQIQELVIGDFNGNGQPELAASVDFGSANDHHLIFLTADRERNPVTSLFEYTGQFYADFGTPTIRATSNGVDVSVPAALRFPLLPIGSAVGNPKFLIEASAQSQNELNDVVYLGFEGGRVVLVINWDPSDTSSVVTLPGNPIPIPVPKSVGGPFGLDLGVVDIDRGFPNVALIDFTMHDFAVLDLNADGIADVVAIGTDSMPNRFINTSLGAGGGVGDPGSGNGQNAGTAFPGIPSLHMIRALGPDQFVVLHSPTPVEISTGFYLGDGVALNGLALLERGDVGDQTASGFVDSRPAPPGFATTVTGASSDGEFWESFNTLTGAKVGENTFVDYSLVIRAGDGGNSLNGKGGNAGFLGGSSKLTNLVDPTTGAVVIDPLTGRPTKDLVGALDVTFQEDLTIARFYGGNGGNGFSSGGTGGFISGLTVLGGQQHSLFGGEGGRGVSSRGGAGGSLVSNSVDYGVFFQAGDGGVGRTGGAGGSIIGNGTGIYDSDTNRIIALAGDGGIGSKGGGNGGSITGFHIVMHAKFAPASFNIFLAGDGGNTVAGIGGTGGSITNCSPFAGTEFNSDLFVEAGQGGNGNTGGAGGNIANFVNLTTGAGSVALAPRYASFLAGDGGKGSFGRGGNGGSITNVDTPTIGSLTLDPASFNRAGLEAAFPDVNFKDVTSRFLFSRVVAGDGGVSSSNIGGDGGAIQNINVRSLQGSWAVVGGSGGVGLSAGGKGGSVANASFEIGGGPATKALFIAGAGGDATAFIPNTDDGAPNQNQNQFGGRVGKGGDGGNLSNIRQPAATLGHVDLIAGDGGSTVHYGTPLDVPKKTFVGKGGSIKSVTLEGSAGNMDPAIGLKSYNDVLNGQTVTQFVQQKLVDPTFNPNTDVPVLLTDALGNIGVTVGAAGRNKAIFLTPQGLPTVYRSLPSVNGTNGSLEFFSASSLVAAVAGNVDRIAAIQFVKALSVGTTGVDKLGSINYLDAFSQPTTTGEPVLDGKLIDGAGVAKKFLTATGAPTLPPSSRWFVR
jgi:hypothetical protein